jgi:CRISPR system Cascade subunit CasD
MILAFDVWATLGTWGTPSLSTGNVSRRETQLHPGKSAVIGLLGAALGTARSELPGLAERVRVACRTDASPSRLPAPDYESIRRVAVPTDDSGQPRRTSRFQELRHMEVLRGGTKAGSILSWREYWAGGGWTIFVDGEVGLLRDVCNALRAPQYPLYAGRRCCPLAFPTDPILLDGPGLSSAVRARPSLRDRLAEPALRGALNQWKRPTGTPLIWEEGFSLPPRAMARRLVRHQPVNAPSKGQNGPAALLRLFSEYVECSAPSVLD